MTHAATLLQAGIVLALGSDAQLTALVGANSVFDHAPKGRNAPHITITRHVLLTRDGDEASGHDHRVQFDVWGSRADRSEVLSVTERIISVLLDADLDDDDLLVTHVRHARTDTRIDPKSGHARASIQMQFFSEPAV